MQFVKDIFNLFFPNICLGCKFQLGVSESIICTTCRHDFSLTNFSSHPENQMERKFYGRIQLQAATALFYFHKKGKVQQLIHELKYRNHQEIGVFFGEWLGEEMKDSNRFNGIDYIVSVPLHPKKIKKRGYNQLTRFGDTLSLKLKVPYVENKLVKIDITDTQTRKGITARWKNVRELFQLSDLNFFEGKHILLIDDVITTGATLESCVNQLLKTKNIKISIAVMVYTE